MVEDTVRAVVRKLDGRLYWHHSTVRLGDDEFGIWLGAPIGTRYRKGRGGETCSTGERRAMLFPRDAWWTALFLAAPAQLDVYCDVTTPARWSHRGEVTTLDLDLDLDLALDVCRTRHDGGVFVDDEDELVRHQRRYASPQQVIDHAESVGPGRCWWCAGSSTR